MVLLYFEEPWKTFTWEARSTHHFVTAPKLPRSKLREICGEEGTCPDPEACFPIGGLALGPTRLSPTPWGSCGISPLPNFSHMSLISETVSVRFCSSCSLSALVLCNSPHTLTECLRAASRPAGSWTSSDIAIISAAEASLTEHNADSYFTMLPRNNCDSSTVRASTSLTCPQLCADAHLCGLCRHVLAYERLQ